MSTTQVLSAVTNVNNVQTGRHAATTHQVAMRKQSATSVMKQRGALSSGRQQSVPVQKEEDRRTPELTYAQMIQARGEFVQKDGLLYQWTGNHFEAIDHKRGETHAMKWLADQFPEQARPATAKACFETACMLANRMPEPKHNQVVIPTLDAYPADFRAEQPHERLPSRAGKGPLMADCVEKLGFSRRLWSTQKIDLHNRSVFNDCYLGNIKPTPENGPKDQLLSFSTESAGYGRWS